MKAIILFAAMLVATVATAVDSFDYHCANIALLQAGGNGMGKILQKEVGLTSAQIAQMNKFAQANIKDLEAYKKSLGGKNANLKVLSGYMDRLKSKVVGVMTPAQVRRLRELNLQAAGLIGLLDKVVATKIGMSDSQYTKFRQIYTDGRKSADTIMRAAQQPISEKYQKLAGAYKGHEKEHEADLKKLFEDYRKEAGAAQQRIAPQMKSITDGTQQGMLAVLTPKEKSAWDGLKGRLFVPPQTK